MQSLGNTEVPGLPVPGRSTAAILARCPSDSSWQECEKTAPTEPVGCIIDSDQEAKTAILAKIVQHKEARILSETRAKRLLEGDIAQLQSAGFATYEIKRDTAEQRGKPGVRLAAMHRLKGLKFERVIVAAANKGILPLEATVGRAKDAVARKNAAIGERSLHYVTLTRARQSATITGYGTMSPFVTALG